MYTCWKKRAARAETITGAAKFHMHQSGIMMHMRTTLILNDDLIRQAQEYTGIQEKTALIHEALRHVIAREAGKRLAALGGTMPDFTLPPRRRSPLSKRSSIGTKR